MANGSLHGYRRRVSAGVVAGLLIGVIINVILLVSLMDVLGILK